MAKYWTCRKCGTRNERTSSRRCAGCGELTKPKARVSRHAQTLRDDGYAVYVEVARVIHGVTDESCCVCGKPRTQERHHDRDHDHKTGLPRGLACAGNRGCNVLMLPWITAPVAAAICIAKAMDREPDAERWKLIAAYLERVEQHYAKEAA